MRISRAPESFWLPYLTRESRVTLVRSRSIAPTSQIRMGWGRPVVLVPGLAGGWPLLWPLAKALAESHEVHLLSSPGDQSWSDPSRCPSTLADLGREMAETLQALNLDRPTVLGVSFGGAVALQMALECPERIEGLVTYGTPLRFLPSFGSRIVQSILRRHDLPHDSAFLNQFFALLDAPRAQRPNLLRFVVRQCWQTDQSEILRRIAMLEDFDLSDELWRIDAPTLVLAGQGDVIVRPDQQRALADRIPGSSYREFAGAGHIGFLSHRRALARTIAKFVRRSVYADR